MKTILLGLFVSISALSFSQKPEKTTKTVVTTENTENRTVEKISRTDSIKVKKIDRKRKVVSPATREELKKEKSNTTK